ncbi:MAG: DUF1761 domain-containing protein [Myxococcota bacterium]
MSHAIADVHWLAVAIATVATTAFGAVWFLVVVPRYYALALGREGAPMPKPSALTNFGPMVCTLWITVTSAILLSALEVQGLGAGLAFGAVVGLGYLVPMTFIIAINPNFPRPLLYGLVNGPFFLLGSLMTSAILVLVR